MIPDDIANEFFEAGEPAEGDTGSDPHKAYRRAAKLWFLAENGITEPEAA